MAHRAVVAVFDTQNQAYDAASDLQQLNDTSVIDIKRGAIVTKDAKGNLSVPDSRGVGTPWGLLGGTVIGGVMGLMLGPAGAAAGAIAGAAAAGATTGAVVGASADLMGLGLQQVFVNEVSAEMDPGKSALLVEVNEGSTEPIDQAVARHHGQVHRSDLSTI